MVTEETSSPSSAVAANFAKLEKAAAHDSNWHCFNYALGADEAVAPINVSNHTEYSSFRQINSTAQEASAKKLTRSGRRR